MPDIDLDQLANEVADQHNKSTEGIQSKADRALKSVHVYHPIQRPKKEGAFTRYLHGAGLPANVPEMEQTAKSFDVWSPENGFNPYALAGPAGPMVHGAITQGLPHMLQSMGEQAEQAHHALNPNNGPDTFNQPNWGDFLKHSLGAAVPIVGPNLAEGNLAGAAGNLTSLLAPKIGDMAGAVVPDQFKFDLINKAIGEGSVDPKFGKDFGRGLARANKGALTRGRIAQPSAGIKTGAGLPEATTSALNEASTLKQKLLQHPVAQSTSIPIRDVIEEHFGPGSIQQNPISGAPEVKAQTPTNVPDPTTAQFSDFGTKLLDELLKRANTNTFTLSPADVEAMRAEKVIDPNYGKFSTEAPEASLNQKATKVSGDLVKRAENALRTRSGESALELLNSHISDLMQGKTILPDKIAEMRTSSTSFPKRIGAKLGEFFQPSIQMGGGKPAGFNVGKLQMPIRTGLASMLTEKPWWLQDPTQGLNTISPIGGAPPIQAQGGPIPRPPAGLLPPGPAQGNPGMLPGMPPGVPQNAPGAPPAQNVPQAGTMEPPATSTPPTAFGGENDPFHWMNGLKERLDKLPDEHIPDVRGAAKTLPDLIRRDLPPEPTHVAQGDQVSGFTPDGSLVSGSLEKLYTSLEDGKPTWKALILDRKKGKTVELPADQVFNKLQGPPGVKKVEGTAKLEGSNYEPPVRSKSTLPKGTNRVVDKPPGSEPAGIAGGPPIGPDDPVGGNLLDMTNKLAKKKYGSWMSRLDPASPDAITTSPELYAAAKRLKFTLRADDYLGFDTPLEAMQAILAHPDFTERWELSPDTLKAANDWKALKQKPKAPVVPFKPRGK